MKRIKDRSRKWPPLSFCFTCCSILLLCVQRMKSHSIHQSNQVHCLINHIKKSPHISSSYQLINFLDFFIELAKWTDHHKHIDTWFLLCNHHIISLYHKNLLEKQSLIGNHRHVRFQVRISIFDTAYFLEHSAVNLLLTKRLYFNFLVYKLCEYFIDFIFWIFSHAYTYEYKHFIHTFASPLFPFLLY